MSATPVLLTDVSPLKTGKGLLRLSLAPLLFPTGPKEIVADFRVVHHRASHLIAVASDFAGKETTCIFEDIDFQWLETNVPSIFEKVTGGWSNPETAQEGLTARFGGSLKAITSIASSKDYPGENGLSPLPEEKAYLVLNREYSEYESHLISKGAIPLQMEDKWLIYREADKLYFHRSWTGYCVYEVSLGHREGRLYLSYGYVNRNREQYSQTDNDYDTALLYYLIDVLLLDKKAQYPIPPGNDAPDFATQWSSVGKSGFK